MGINFGYSMSDTASEWSKRRRKRVAGKLANVCPHIAFIEPTTREDGAFALQVQYLIETFAGTTSYFCRGCDTEWSNFNIDVYQKHLMSRFEADMVGTSEDIKRKMSEADGLVKKLNRMGGHPGR